MNNSKTNMPYELKKQCHKVIHTATVAAATAGAAPIPMSDAVPITAAQVTMIIALGKIFDLTLSASVARSLASITMTQQVGRTVASNILKLIPGAGTVIGGVVGASTAATLTEAMGWLLADDFYRIYVGDNPKQIAESALDVTQLFNGLRIK